MKQFSLKNVRALIASDFILEFFRKYLSYRAKASELLKCRDAYQVTEHLLHEVHKDSVVVPLSSEFLHEGLILQLHQLRVDLLIDVLEERELEVVVDIFGFV